MEGGGSLHAAAGGNDQERVCRLLNAGADPNARNDLGQTPLHLAAMFDAIVAFGMLLQNGCDLDFKDDQGRTALHCAAESNRTQAIVVLLNGGADCSIRDRHGLTPLLLASREQATEAVATLEDAYITACMHQGFKQTIKTRSHRRIPSRNDAPGSPNER